MADSAIPATYADPQAGVYLGRAAFLVGDTILGRVTAATPITPPVYPLLVRLDRLAWRGSWRGSLRGER